MTPEKREKHSAPQSGSGVHPSSAKTPAAGDEAEAQTSSPGNDDRAIALYEERRKLLPGLWLSDAPDWHDLPEDVKARWRRTAGN